MHSVFGEMVDGMDVVFNISTIATDAGSRPLTDVVIEQIDILRIGTDAQNFDFHAQPLPEVTPLPLSIDLTPELEVSTIAVSNQCEVQIFNSTNLFDWIAFNEQYFPAATNAWEQAVSISLTTEFFKAAQVYYPQAVTAFSDIEDHTLTFTQGANIFVFTPATGGTGTCSIIGNPDTLTFWTEWTSEPYQGRVVFQPSIYYAFQLTLSPDGICTGFQWNGSAWNNIGEFSFTNTPPTP